MVDLNTRWIKLIPLQDIQATTICTAFDHNWLCRYPRPDKVTTDQGTQFTGNEFQELCESYGIQVIHTSAYNPTANSICERIHGFVNNAIRCSQNTRWSDELPAIAWSLRTTYHRRLKCSPCQLVFGTNMIYSRKRNSIEEQLKITNEAAIAESRKELAKNNSKRISHTYQPGQLVFIKNHEPTKTQSRYSGPYPIIQVFQEKSACSVHCDSYIETFSFRRLKPYLSEEADCRITDIRTRFLATTPDVHIRQCNTPDIARHV
jgi:hypothetical protein